MPSAMITFIGAIASYVHVEDWVGMVVTLPLPGTCFAEYAVALASCVLL